MGLESMSQRMSSYGKNLLLEERVDDAEALMKKISEVNTEKCAHVIDKIFDMNKMNIAILGNIEKNNFYKYFSF